MPPRIVLIDVMDTIVYDPFYREIPAFFGMSLEELIAAKDPTAWREFERGEIDEATYYARYFADGRAIDAAGLARTVRTAYRWLPGMEILVPELHDAGVEMHALSNYPVWYRWIEESLALGRYLDWTFVSCHTGVRKPRAEAYLGAARRLDVDPTECLFIDDRARNCAGAAAVAMPAIEFTGAEALRSALVAHGLLER